jgi:putative membrane protein
MKSSSHHSILDRRILVTAALSVLLGTSTAAAQSAGSGAGGAGSGNYGAGSTGTSSTSTTGTNASDDAKHTTDTSAHKSASGSASSDTSGSTSASRSTDTTTGSSSTIGTTSTTDTSTAGGATTMTGRDSASRGKLGWMERRFVTKAADSGTTEINLAKLAAERATNSEVKSFAQKLVDDHTKVGEELKTLAGQKNVKLDDDDLGSDRAHKRLSKKSGAEFDQEFVEHMVDMHEADVKMFEKAAEDAKDPELKSFAAKHVDHLRQHLQQAQSLRSSLMPTGRTDETSLREPSSTSTSTDTSRGSASTPDTQSSSSSSNYGTGSTSTGTSSSSTSSDTSTGSPGSSTSDTNRNNP